MASKPRGGPLVVDSPDSSPTTGAVTDAAHVETAVDAIPPLARRDKFLLLASDRRLRPARRVRHAGSVLPTFGRAIV